MKVEKGTVKKSLAVVSLCVIILLTGIGIGIIYGTSAPVPSSTFNLSPGIYPGAPSFTIWREGDNYFAKVR